MKKFFLSAAVLALSLTSCTLDQLADALVKSGTNIWGYGSVNSANKAKVDGAVNKVNEGSELFGSLKGGATKLGGAFGGDEDFNPENLGEIFEGLFDREKDENGNDKKNDLDLFLDDLYSMNEADTKALQEELKGITVIDLEETVGEAESMQLKEALENFKGDGSNEFKESLKEALGDVNPEAADKLVEALTDAVDTLISQGGLNMADVLTFAVILDVASGFGGEQEGAAPEDESAMIKKAMDALGAAQKLGSDIFGGIMGAFADIAGAMV